MTGLRIEVAGLEETLSRLGEAAEKADHPRGFYDRIGLSLVNSASRRFELGAGPDGSPWPPSIRALAEGGQTLVDTARLVGSITHEATDTGVAVGTNVIYAAIHQLGGTIRPKSGNALVFNLGGRTIFARQVTIPARPFLGLDRDDEIEIEAIAGEWLLGEEQEDGA
jgi:phage virion morphogenesis protein